MKNSEKSKQHSLAMFPGHWLKLASKGIGWFVTYEIWELPDQRRYHWHSRRHRKGRGGLIESGDTLTASGSRRRLRWWGWAPASLTWWIAIIFTLGSVLLAVGALGPFTPERIIHTVTFSFFGSTCFTIANYLSLLEIFNADRRIPREVERLEPRVAAARSANDAANRTIEPVKFRWWVWMPYELAFVATFTMFVGGLLFKLCYIFGVLKWLSWVEVDILINMPGLIGSLCFLVASYLYIVEVVHRPWGIQLQSIAWWSAFTCLLGSVCYNISAIYGFFGDGPILIEQKWGNYAAVFTGAIFFIISSYLMIPEALDRPEQENG